MSDQGLHKGIPMFDPAYYTWGCVDPECGWEEDRIWDCQPSVCPKCGDETEQR